MAVATVSVRELRDQIEPILRRVAEQGETIAVVDDGKEVARLVPPLPERRPVSAEELAAIRDRRQRLAEEIGAHWPEGVTAEDAIRDIRRDL